MNVLMVMILTYKLNALDTGHKTPVLIHDRIISAQTSETSDRNTIFIFLLQAFVFVCFWYQLFCGFSGSVMIDQMYLMLYNLVFTSLPPMAIGKLIQLYLNFNIILADFEKLIKIRLSFGVFPTNLIALSGTTHCIALLPYIHLQASLIKMRPIHS